jgi:preprotein translocase subunit SecG
MFQLIVVVMIILSLFMMLVVLIQNPKGAGTFSGGVGGAAADVFGVQRTGDVLEKTTWVTIAALLVLSVLSSVFLPKTTEAGKQKTRTEQTTTGTTSAPMSLPTQPNAAPGNAPQPAPAPQSK